MGPLPPLLPHPISSSGIVPLPLGSFFFPRCLFHIIAWSLYPRPTFVLFFSFFLFSFLPLLPIGFFSPCLGCISSSLFFWGLLSSRAKIVSKRKRERLLIKHGTIAAAATTTTTPSLLGLPTQQ